MKSQLVLITLLLSIAQSTSIKPAFARSQDPILQQAIAATESRHPSKAIALLDRALQKRPNWFEAYIERGKAKYWQQDYRAAIADFDLALQYDPKSVNAYIERGKAKQGQQDYRGAIADFDRALQYQPNSVSAYINRGSTKHSQGENQAAIADFDLAISYNPKSTDAYRWRAYVKGELKQYTAQVEDLDRAIALDPQLIPAYVWRGRVYRNNLNQKERGDRDFDRALTIENRRIDDYFKLSFIFDDRKNYQEGIDFFTKEISSNSRYGKYAYLQRSLLYEQLKKYDLAIGDLLTYLNYYPETHAKKIIFDGLSNNYSQLARYQEAIDYANKALAIDPKYADAFDNRAWAFYRLKNYSAAIADVNTAISISPKQGRYYTLRGYIDYYGFNNYHQALKEFDRAIELGEGRYAYEHRAYVKSRLKLPALADYQQALKLARKEGDRQQEQKIEKAIEDIHTEPQRTAIGMAIAGLCTGGIYAGLGAIARHNERKYLQQLESEVGDGSDRH